MSAVVNPLSRNGEEEIVFFCGNNLSPLLSVSSHLFIRNSGEHFPREEINHQVGKRAVSCCREVEALLFVLETQNQNVWFNQHNEKELY